MGDRTHASFHSEVGAYRRLKIDKKNIFFGCSSFVLALEVRRMQDNCLSF